MQRISLIMNRLNHIYLFWVDRVEGNENILENVPHCQMEDLALTYHVLLNKDGEGISKAMITNSWLEILGVTQEQLHQDALNNSQKLFPLSVMTITQAVIGGIDPTGVFASSQESLEEALKDEEIPLIVVTNKTKTDGAAALFYPEVMEQLGGKNWRFYDSAFLYARNIDSTRFRRDADTASQRNGSRG